MGIPPSSGASSGAACSASESPTSTTFVGGSLSFAATGVVSDAVESDEKLNDEEHPKDPPASAAVVSTRRRRGLMPGGLVRGEWPPEWITSLRYPPRLRPNAKWCSEHDLAT